MLGLLVLARCEPYWPCRDRTTTSSVLVFLAFFSFFAGFRMFTEHFAVGIERVTPFFAILADDGFIMAALFLPPDYRSAFELLLRRLLDCLRHIRAVNVFFFFLVSVSVGGSTEGESGADRCDC